MYVPCTGVADFGRSLPDVNLWLPPPITVFGQYSLVGAVRSAVRGMIAVMSPESDADGLVVWEVQRYEPFSRVWICKGYGRTTTDVDPVELGRAALAGHLARVPARGGETFRAVVRTGAGGSLTISPDDLRTHGSTVDPEVCQILPGYLRDALT